jgi:hypothetical protein
VNEFIAILSSDDRIGLLARVKADFTLCKPDERIGAAALYDCNRLVGNALRLGGKIGAMVWHRISYSNFSDE